MSRKPLCAPWNARLIGNGRGSKWRPNGMLGAKFAIRMVLREERFVTATKEKEAADDRG